LLNAKCAASGPWSRESLINGRYSHSFLAHPWLEFYAVQFTQNLRAQWTIWQRIQDVGLRRGEILLSFDDGPHPTVTARLLDVLQKEDVRGAFCVCGRLVRVAPDIVCRMASEGHLIVNHGDRHQPLALFSEEALRKEIQNCDLAIAAALKSTAFRAEFYRPACGLWTSVVKRVLAQLNKRVLPVTHFGWDTNVNRHTYRNWIAITQDAARRDRGGIFVLHDQRLHFWLESGYDPNDLESSAYRGWVPDAAAELINRFRSDSFTFLDPHVWSRRDPAQPVNERSLDPGKFSGQTDPE
jgi:peptidoglycan/xylan/chitin deacetylase (PgdA/CDA1 family)